MDRLDAKFQYLLRLGDNPLVLSQRLCELVGKGPALEEDMALSNVALDLLGQTRLWLSYAGELEGKGRDEDKLAYLRDAHDYRNCLLVEQPNGNYAQTLMRQFLFDSWHYFAIEALTRASDHRIADIAAKSLKEVTYHLRRSSDLVVRLGDGTPTSHALMQDALEELWMYSGELLDYDAIDMAMLDEGIAPEPAALRAQVVGHLREVLDEATLSMPSPDSWMQRGGKQGRHSEYLGYLLAEMQFLQRAYPGASW